MEMRDEEIELEADQPNPEMIERLERRNRQQESWRGRMMVKEIVNKYQVIFRLQKKNKVIFSLGNTVGG